MAAIPPLVVLFLTARIPSPATYVAPTYKPGIEGRSLCLPQRSLSYWPRSTAAHSRIATAPKSRLRPPEIADAAHQCYKAGASVVHIHARGADKGPTSDIKVFSDIISASGTSATF